MHMLINLSFISITHIYTKIIFDEKKYIKTKNRGHLTIKRARDFIKSDVLLVTQLLQFC